MSKIISDFVQSSGTTYGVGFFQGDTKAIKCASDMSKAQIRGWKKRKRVPGAFFHYLRLTQIIPPDAELPPMDRREVEEVTKFLWKRARTNEGALSMCEYMIHHFDPELLKLLWARKRYPEVA